MFLDQDPGGQGVMGIFVQHRYGGLHDDGAGIHPCIHKVDGAAGDLHPVVQGLSLGIQSRKGRQQGRMDVDDLVVPGIHEIPAEDPHESGQHHQFHPCFPECLVNGGFEGSLVHKILTGNGAVRDPHLFRPLEGIGFRTVADHHGDFDGQVFFFDFVGHGLEIASPAADQYPDFPFSHRKPRLSSRSFWCRAPHGPVRRRFPRFLSDEPGRRRLRKDPPPAPCQPPC